MTKLQKFILKRMAREIVLQGGHQERMIEYYRILAEAAREEFTEDTGAGLNDFLKECFNKSLKVDNACKCCGRKF